MTDQIDLEQLFIKVGKAHRYLAGQLLDQHDIHRGQPPLLYALSKQDGQTNSELAGCLEVTPATITNMVKRMEKAGLVKRQRDAADERLIRVLLTEHGRDLFARVDDTLREINKIAFGNFSEEEKREMLQLLEKMLGNLHQHKESV